MITLIQANSESVMVNPDHVSLVRGYTTLDGKKMTEILFMSGDWRTFDMSFDEVKAAVLRG